MNEIWKLEVQHVKKHEQSNSQTGCNESTAPTSAASILTVAFVICFLLYQCFVHFSLLCSVAATQHTINSGFCPHDITHWFVDYCFEALVFALIFFFVVVGARRGHIWTREWSWGA